MKLGFIGYKGHALRLIDIMSKDCEITHFYHPKKINPPMGVATQNLKDLYSCDAIIISSPNNTHFEYLEKLKDFEGYIFCEKPPISTLEELEKLKEFPKEKIYFNFNMRFGFLLDVLQDYPQKYDLGDPIIIDVITGYGLGFKKEYKSSWRAKKELHKLGVMETLGIHFFDLVSFCLGEPNNINCQGDSFSPLGDSIDTFYLSASFKDCFFSLTCSYCIPFIYHIKIVYTNGLIDLTSKSIKVYSPRDTFKNGLFITPPLVYEQEIDIDEFYLNSLKKSCKYFLNCVSEKNTIDVKHFNQSISSNSHLLSCTQLLKSTS
jgi:predicted dehydrogenase